MVYPIGSSEVGPEALEGQSRARRSNVSPDALVTLPMEGVETVHDVLIYAARTHGDQDAMGTRSIEKVIEEEKEVTKTVGGKEVKEMKKWKYWKLSDYKYLSFNQFKDKVGVAAAALVSLGINRNEVFNIYATTSLNWQLVSHACAQVSVTIATAYETLGEDGLAHSLSEPDCVGVFTNAELLPTLLRVLPRAPTVRVIVYDDEPKAGIVEQLKAVRDDVKVLSLDEFLALGKESPATDLKERLPKSDDLACIMYTSGTTGAPKGVMLTHSNLIASVGAVYKLLGHALAPKDSFLAFLPLAHILEYIVELTLFFVGVTTGFGRIKTLTDASVRECSGDLNAFKPTIMVGVPAIWETIRKGIVGKLNAGGAVAKMVFNTAYTLKKYKVPVLAQLVDAVVFSKVRAQTGSRLRLVLSGGAALSRETQEFMSVALVTVLQGYGMTESCGMCTILTPDQFRYGAVGVPSPSIEIKLVDVPEAGYVTSKTPQQGEIWIRGPSVTKGYFKRDDLNKDESIFAGDGWFRTGDVGEWNDDGTLNVIDRIKNLVKLQGGEYIALERLESTYKSCNLVGNICVHAVPDARQPMGLIFPHESNLRHALQATPPPGLKVDPKTADLHTLSGDPAVRDFVQKECNAVAKKAGLKPMEQLEAVVLTPDEWTPESGLVTAAQKVQRKAIATRYADEIKAAYGH